MVKIGYMRISTDKQDHALQYDALKAAGCSEIFQDTISGSVASREGLDSCLSTLEPGDTLVVWKLDRLGRTARTLYNLVGDLKDQNISFISLMENMDTSTPMGRALFGFMAVYAEMERETIQMRVKAGLNVARSKGKKLGPKFKYKEENLEMVKSLSRAGMSQKEITKRTGISQSTVSRILTRTGDDQ